LLEVPPVLVDDGVPPPLSSPASDFWGDPEFNAPPHAAVAQALAQNPAAITKRTRALFLALEVPYRMSD
jgi:hypothetical protein